MARRAPGVRTRTTTSAERGGGIRVLRSAAVAHMKELVNRGQGTNYALRIRRK